MTTIHPIPRRWRQTWIPEAVPSASRPTHDPGRLRATLLAGSTAAPSVPLAVVAALALAVWGIAVVPEIVAVDRSWWHARFLVPAGVGGLVAWLLAERRPPRATRHFVAATSLACFVLLLLLPNTGADFAHGARGDLETLALAHVPLVLLGAAAAAFTGRDWRTTAARLAFVRFLGTVLALGAVLVVGGFVVGLLTVLLYSALGVELFDSFLRWVVLPGVCMAPLLAASVGARLAGRGEDLARTLVRLIAPPLLLVAATWPLAVIGGHGLGDRDVLSQLHWMLVVVVRWPCWRSRCDRPTHRWRAAMRWPRVWSRPRWSWRCSRSADCCRGSQRAA